MGRRVEKLPCYFTGRLSGLEVTAVKDLEPFYDDSLAYCVMVGNSQVQVRFSARRPHPEKGYIDISKLERPQVNEVLRAIEELYCVVATDALLDEQEGEDHE